MGFYRDRVIPPVIDLVMRSKDLVPCRSELVSAASGHVLEIGIGSGLNLPYYSGQVTQLVGVDPSANLLDMTRRKTGRLPFPVELVQRTAEELPLDARSIDTAVLTWALCSIPEPMRALREVKRVLKPEGRLLFIEHGLSSDAGVRAWQDRLNPAWRLISGGCNLNRKIDDLIREAGWKVLDLRNFYLPGLRVMTYTYRGVALPA